MIATCMPAIRGHAVTVELGTAAGAGLGWGRGAGTRLETVISAVAAGPRLPAPSTACTESLMRRSGVKFQVAEMHLDRSPGCGRERDQLARHLAAIERHEETERSRRGPSSGGVIHETRASPAGNKAVPGSTRRSARGIRRPAVVRPELDREIGSARPVLLAAIDKPIGKNPQRELVAGSCPFRAGVVEDAESHGSGRPRGLRRRAGRPECAASRRDPAARRRPCATVCRHYPARHGKGRRPPIDHGRSGCRRWRNVDHPAERYSWCRFPRTTRPRRC